MVFDDFSNMENPGRDELVQFIKKVVEFLDIIVANQDQRFNFLWEGSPELQQQAQATFEADIIPSANALIEHIPELDETQIERHGLSGQPLAFKFAVIGTISRQWENVRDALRLPEWLKRLIDAIDVVLKSIIDAATITMPGIGGALVEFKDAIAALIPTRD